MVHTATKGESQSKNVHSSPKGARGAVSVVIAGIKSVSAGTKKAAFTLTEITLVIGLLLGLMLAGLSATGWFAKMSDAKKAESVLRLVQNARMSWLIENPTNSIADVTLANLEPYLAAPGAIRELGEMGYELNDTGVRREPIQYSLKDPEALPISGFELSGGN